MKRFHFIPHLYRILSKLGFVKQNPSKVGEFFLNWHMLQLLPHKHNNYPKDIQKRPAKNGDVHKTVKTAWRKRSRRFSYAEKVAKRRKETAGENTRIEVRFFSEDAERNKLQVTALFYVYQQVIKSALQSMPPMQSSTQFLDIEYLSWFPKWTATP